MSDQRLLPQAIDAEQAILGALLQMPEAWTKVSEILRPELFYIEANRQIYRIANDLHSSGIPVDIISVMTRLRAEGLAEAVGAPVYLTQLTARVGSTANIEYHARILVEQFIARSLIRIGHDAEVSAYSTSDALALLDRVSGDISTLYGYLHGSTLSDASTGIFELSRKKNEGGLSFGIPDLDRMTMMQPGLPYVFAGRPGLGKSILAVHIFWHLTQFGNVLLFSPEMTLTQVQARIVSSESGVPYSTILRGAMNEQDVALVEAAVSRIGDRLTRLKVDPTSGITPDQMDVRVERAIKKHGILAFGVDHLHKMKTGDKRVDREETAKVSQCMEGITGVAKKSMLPAVVLCQLNREVEKRQGKKPTLADLKQTGKIEEDAAFVGLLFRNGYYEEHPPYSDTLEISVAKNRDGAVGMAKEGITPSLSRIGITETFTSQTPF